jgi:tetratricopeptide (TPR) repeat protein/MFS family permease
MNRTTDRSQNSWRKLIPGATVFLSNACIVVLAMVVSRMAAAELGASLYTWTSVIGVMLAALGAGSFLGGRIADKYHPFRALSVLFALSSAACVLVVIVSNALSDWMGLWSFHWPLHVLIHVASLLLLPVTLFAAIAPVAGRIACEGSAKPGRTLGAFCAWAACGALAGVFLTGFFLIPIYGNVLIVWSISVVSLTLAFLYWISCWVLYLWGMIFAVLLIFATAAAPWAVETGTSIHLRAAQGTNILYQSETTYGRVTVVRTSQRPDKRAVWLDQVAQGAMVASDVTDLQDFQTSIGAALLHVLYPADSEPSILFLGSGGYILPRYAKACWPQGRIEVVEPDSGIANAATRVLGLEAGSLKTVSLNARAYVNALLVRLRKGRSVVTYDFICTQADSPLAMPFQLVTKSFHDELGQILSPRGFYVLNVVDTPDEKRFLGAVVSTLKRTFSQVHAVTRAAAHPGGTEQFVVIASRRELDLRTALSSWDACPAFRILDQAEMDRLKEQCGNMILDDERAPVATLLTSAVRREASQTLARKCLQRAVMFDEQGRDEQSLALYSRAASLDGPEGLDAYMAIGRWHETNGDFDKAVGAFETALRDAVQYDAAPGTTARIHVELATLSEKMNRAPQAREHLLAAVEAFQTEVKRHPKSLVAWECLGDAFVRLQDWSKAGEAFSRSLDLEPANPAHYEKLAKALELQGRYDEAIPVVRRQIDLLKVSGRKDGVIQQSQYLELLEYERVKQRK